MDTRKEFDVRTSILRASAKALADPLRPVYHFLPPAQWMNDPNGTIQIGGEYHVFYQLNPFGDSWNHIHWGHSKTYDFLEWIHLPVALYPNERTGEAHCFSGCCTLNGDGVPTIFYTSVSFDREAQPNTQRVAFGDGALRNWRQGDEPVLTMADIPFPVENDWRDPYVFRDSGSTFLIVGVKPVGATFPPSVVLFRSDGDALTSWRYIGKLFTAPVEVPFLECPNFVRVDGEWVLIYSPIHEVEYHSGKFDPGTGRFESKVKDFVNYSSEYYATNTIVDSSGRVILLAWIRGFPKGRGWNGCHAIPRELHLDEGGNLLQTPIREMDRIRHERGEVGADTLREPTIELNHIPLWTLELHLNCALITQSSVRVVLSSAEEEILEIELTRELLRVNSISVPFSATGTRGSDHSLQIYFDRSVVELFADEGRYCISTVLDDLIHAESMIVERSDGAEISAIEYWTMGQLHYSNYL